MSADDLTASETLVLLTLLVEARAVPNPELKKLGPELRPESRRKLNRLGLVATDTTGRPYTHELTDKGWVRCREEIGAEAPPQAGPWGRVLYTVLRGLGRHLARTDQRLSEVFLPEPEPAESAGDGAPGTVEAAAPSTEERVRAAYLQLAGGSAGEWVSLTRLRPALPDLSKDELDRELVRMYRLPDVTLVPQENQKILTDRDRAAAVMIGNQDKHAIAIEAR